MPYVTSIERLALERSKTEGLLEGIEVQLEQRFGAAGIALLPVIRKVEDHQRLKDIVKAIGNAANVDDLRKALP